MEVPSVPLSTDGEKCLKFVFGVRVCVCQKSRKNSNGDRFLEILSSDFSLSSVDSSPRERGCLSKQNGVAEVLLFSGQVYIYLF